jgi:hypothetical protein
MVHRRGLRARAPDFSEWLDGPIFEPLQDPEFFARFFLDGGTVAWYERAQSSEAA